jgi:hypothetical protein
MRRNRMNTLVVYDSQFLKGKGVCIWESQKE